MSCLVASRGDCGFWGVTKGSRVKGTRAVFVHTSASG
jgi:hypothetical protein